MPGGALEFRCDLANDGALPARATLLKGATPETAHEQSPAPLFSRILRRAGESALLRAQHESALALEIEAPAVAADCDEQTLARCAADAQSARAVTTARDRDLALNF